MAVGFGLSAVGTAIGVFIKGYFDGRDKRVDATDSDFKAFKDETLKERGNTNTEIAKLGGKIDNLADKLEIYTKEVTKLEGKVEQNTDALTKQTTLLDHSIRQNKRLFEHLGLRRPDNQVTG